MRTAGSVAPLAGVPAVAAGGQGGLLDVLADSGFDAQPHAIYSAYSEPEAGGSANSTALAQARLSADDARLEGVK